MCSLPSADFKTSVAIVLVAFALVEVIGVSIELVAVRVTTVDVLVTDIKVIVKHVLIQLHLIECRSLCCSLHLLLTI
jgi:hypothetical protein